MGATFYLASCGTTLTGRVSVQGNMPHSYLALSTGDGTYEIQEGELHDKLRKDYQGATVTLEVEILREPEGPMRGRVKVFSITEDAEKTDD